MVLLPVGEKQMQAILENRVGINEQSTVYLPLSKRPAIAS
jgi:hypothetical protein